MSGRLPGAMAAVAACVLITSCDSGSPARPSASASASLAAQCTSVVTSIIDATQKYVTALEPQPSGSPQPTPYPATDYQAAVQSATDSLSRLGCDPAASRQTLDAQWSRLHADGPVARAVLAQFKATFTQPSAGTPEAKSVGTDANLGEVLAALPEGSTLTLQPGTYRLDSTLVLLRAITVVGAGSGRTVLESTAADDALLVLTAKAVTLRALSVRHTGTKPANVVTTGAQAALTLDGVRVGGARSAKSGGGVGLLLPAPSSPATTGARTTTLTVQAGEFSDNPGGGIVVAGRHRASITAVTFTRNGQCGVCFLGTSDGWVTASTFRANDVGVSAMDDARPILRKNTFSGGQIGIQVSDRAAPTVEANTITASQRAALVYAGKAAGTVDANTCAKDRPGIVIVGTEPYPYLKKNACAVATAR